jgi:hypothetical protein
MILKESVSIKPLKKLTVANSIINFSCIMCQMILSFKLQDQLMNYQLSMVKMTATLRENKCLFTVDTKDSLNI